MSAGTGNGDTRRVGSMCSGYGGLDLAVEKVFGPVRYEWHAENDPDPSKVLAAHWDVPNLGDLTAVDWSSVEPVDILAAGFPCQPVSSAGRRQGLDDDRWLFDDIATAVGRMVTQPRLCVFENVPGLLTANRGHAMARVVQRLAALGYVGRYRTVRASDVGAAHRRERVFIVARLAADANGGGRAAADADFGRALRAGGAKEGSEPESRRVASDAFGGGPVAARAGVLSLLPTPRPQTKGGGAAPDTTWHLRKGAGGPNLITAIAMATNLLPTPRARDGKGRDPNPRGVDLNEAVALLPTPTAMHSARNATAGRSPDAKPFDLGWTLADIAYADRWGEYAPAIARWEHVTGRPAPDPTEPGTKGQPRLSPRFVEWLMGLPAGWVTDHLPRNAALRVLGNGVVPQQAAYAIEGLVS